LLVLDAQDVALGLAELFRLSYWVLAFAPIAISAATAFFLRGGGFTAHWYAIGAREPSKREKEIILVALTELATAAPQGTIGPSKTFVIDDEALNAYIVGSTLYLTRGLVHSPHLLSVAAHELGHLNSSDGQLTLALRQLVLPPLLTVSRVTGQAARAMSRMKSGTISDTGLILGCLSPIIFLAGGGIGYRLLSPLWAKYWREREYAADLFAAQCGQAAGLVAFLRQHQFFDVAVPYYRTEHPYSELRIERLEDYEQGVQVNELEVGQAALPAVSGVSEA
jgi:Zn-dependent protease with chaperone function